ncbi:MAG: WG repeat-containing protein [Crocinitomix sp.]|nr:WG repeat-containing protein [Crocinitomix sp.]
MRKIALLFALILVGLSSQAKNKTWTCINEDGDDIFSMQAIHISDFHNGMAAVHKNTLVNNEWVTGDGYVNTKGEIVIPCNLLKAQDFKADVAWIRRDGENFYRLIDKTGKVIPTKKYKKVGTFFVSNLGRCAVYEDGKMGFIDETGKEVIPCIYTGSLSFTEGLACVALASSAKGEYGFINRDGEVVIPLKFIQAGTSSFRNGLARATVERKTVLIDKEGKVVFKTKNGNIQGVHDGLISVITKPNRKGWGWINFKDEFVINPTYDYAINFNEDGYGVVEKNELKGMIDTTGKVILPLKYETIYCNISKDGYFCGVYPSSEVTSLANARKDYFDADLNLIPLENVKYLMGAKNGNRIAFSNMEGKLGFMDRNYHIVIPPLFAKVKTFSEGFAWVRH